MAALTGRPDDPRPAMCEGLAHQAEKEVGEAREFPKMPDARVRGRKPRDVGDAGDRQALGPEGRHEPHGGTTDADEGGVLRGVKVGEARVSRGGGGGELVGPRVAPGEDEGGPVEALMSWCALTFRTALRNWKPAACRM